MSVLREVASRKPVVIWKGGRTQDGVRAAASHTGSLAISQTIWESAVKQCGALRVTGLEEMIDTVKALVFLPPVRGKRVADVLKGDVGKSDGPENVADAWLKGLKQFLWSDYVRREI